MVEKFKEKTSFIERLGLSEETEMSIRQYHCHKNQIICCDDGGTKYSDRGITKTYGELLKVARTLYVPIEKQTELGLEPIDFKAHTLTRLNGWYIVRYRPKDLDPETWENLIKAFSLAGFLRPIFDERCLLWAEIDYAFKYLMDHYSDGYVEYNTDELPMAIGHLNPRVNGDYEDFSGQLTYEGILRVFKYLRMRYIGYNLYEDSQKPYEEIEGWFMRSVLDDYVTCLAFARTDVLLDINKIYYGRPVFVEI